MEQENSINQRLGPEDFLRFLQTVDMNPNPVASHDQTPDLAKRVLAKATGVEERTQTINQPPVDESAEFLRKYKNIGQLFSALGLDGTDFDKGGVSKAIALGARFPTSFHGTKGLKAKESILNEGVNLHRASVGDIIGGAFHHTPNKDYAKEFAHGYEDPVGTLKEDLLVGVKLKPESKIMNLIPADVPTGMFYGALKDFPRLEPESSDLINAFLRRFGREPRTDINTNLAELTNALQSNPDEVTRFGIDHIAYMDGMQPAIATPRPSNLISTATGEPLKELNRGKMNQQMFTGLEAGPIKSYLEHPQQFDKLPNRYVFDVNKMKKVGDQLGSNPGGTFQVPGVTSWDRSKPTYYAKSSPNEEVILNELYGHALQNKLLRENVETSLGRLNNDPALLTKWMPSFRAAKPEDFDDYNSFWQGMWNNAKSDRDRNFTFDVLMRNWDVGAPGNIGTVGGAHRILRPDMGGSLYRRAQGSVKPGDFRTSALDDLKSMRDPNINPDTARMYRNANISDHDLYTWHDDITGLTSRKDGDKYAIPEQLADDLIHRLRMLQDATVDKESKVIVPRNYKSIQAQLDELDPQEIDLTNDIRTEPVNDVFDNIPKPEVSVGEPIQLGATKAQHYANLYGDYEKAKIALTLDESISLDQLLEQYTQLQKIFGIIQK